jgi:hypothetical protein
VIGKVKETLTRKKRATQKLATIASIAKQDRQAAEEILETEIKTVLDTQFDKVEKLAFYVINGIGMGNITWENVEQFCEQGDKLAIATKQFLLEKGYIKDGQVTKAGKKWAKKMVKTVTKKVLEDV